MPQLSPPYVVRRPLWVQRTVVSNAELKTLNATAVTVVPAPGAGKYLAVRRIHVQYVYATAAFDSVGSGDDLEFRYTGASGAKVVTNVETTGMLDQTADKYADAVGIDVIPVANAPIVAHLATGEVYSAAGGGSLVVTTYYSVLDY